VVSGTLTQLRGMLGYVWPILQAVVTARFFSLVTPMLTITQIRLVQESLRSVMTQYDEAAHAFYENLFELRPEYQLLFKGDVAEQGHKLVRMVETAVTGLRKFDLGTPALETLARRHLNYQVTEEMYGPMTAPPTWYVDCHCRRITVGGTLPFAFGVVIGL